MLIPLLGMTRLVSRDPRPMCDRVTRAIRAVKHADLVTEHMLDHLSQLGGISGQLVAVSVD